MFYSLYFLVKSQYDVIFTSVRYLILSKRLLREEVFR